MKGGIRVVAVPPGEAPHAMSDRTATFERVLAAYPREGALQTAVGSRTIIPISWVVDARLVSPRLAGWSEDELGVVDYARIRFPGKSRSR